MKNKELWGQIHALSENLNITWLHIPRDSVPQQIEADKLAKAALSAGKTTCTLPGNARQDDMHVPSAEID